LIVISLRGLDPGLRANAEAALVIARQYGVPVQVTSVRRTLEQQTRLRNNYELCLQRGVFPSDASLSPGMSCRYPANRPGDSAHNYGLAWDSWVPDEYWELWDAIRGYCGFELDPNDRVHAQYPNWRQVVGA
jgi:hypothetical protein